MRPLTALLAILSSADATMQQPDHAPNRIVVRNEIIQVKVGRLAFISPHDHLTIHVEDGHNCEVRVLMSPVEQLIGEVNVDRFPCDFTESEISYQHFGRSTPKTDRISLQVLYDTTTEKLVLPIQLEIEVLLEKYDIVTNHQIVNLYQNMGDSEPIDDTILSLNYDKQKYECFIRLPTPYQQTEKYFIANQRQLSKNYPSVVGSPPYEYRFVEDNPRVGLWPRYGELVNANSDMTCENFVNSGIFYRHTAAVGSPNRDHQPLIIDLISLINGQVVEREMYDLQIHIRSGEPNEAPGVDDSSNLVLVANQFILTALTKEIIFVNDYESDAENLIIELDQQPEFGHFISTDDRTRPILAFYQYEIFDHKIAYQPPFEDSGRDRLSQVNFRVIDEDGKTSEWTPLYIRVKSRATSAPIAVENNGLILYEGQGRCIGPDSLLLSDENTDVRSLDIRVVDGMKHGSLLLREHVADIFTGEDLELCDVIYHHDDSDTYVDNLILRINDGQNTIEILFPIWIVPIDDQPPQIIRNLGAEIYKGGKVYLDIDDSDVDSDGPAIYKLISRLNKGELFVQQITGEWAVSRTFTTEQLRQDQVQYIHNKQAGSLTVDMEDLTFTAEDESGNIGPEFNYTIIINPKDNEPPKCNKQPDCDMGIKVEEYATVPIRPNILEYVDDTSQPEDIVFDIIYQPTDVDTGELMGRLLSADTLEPLTQFNQKQVNHLKVLYEAPNRDLGLIRRTVQFTFDVSDAMQNTVYGQIFTIDLLPVDNEEPVVTNEGLQAMQGSFVIFTTNELDITDADTELTLLAFLLLEEPKHGAVWANGFKLNPGEEFFQPDIAADDIEYRHNDDNSLTDTIKLEASDGVHHFPVNINVIIIPRPVIPEPTQRNPSENTLVVPEKSSTELSRDKYFLTPPDDADKDITFTLVEKPKHGSILHDGKPLREDSGKFGASDISNGRVIYAHDGAEIGPGEVQDMYKLLAQDKQGLAKPMSIITRIRVIPVDNQYPIVNILREISVQEGGKAVLNPSHTDIRDQDTNSDDIICRIDPQPQWGYLENISPLLGSEKSRSGIAITDFKASDLPNEYINYVQNIHKGYEPTVDEFFIACRDKANNESPKKRIGVVLDPINDEPPKIEFSRWRVREGGFLNIDETLLDCRDMDVPEDDLLFIIIEPPKFGRMIYFGANTLEATTSIDSFTCLQLKSQEIGYEHDDSENFDDSMKLQLADGIHFSEENIKIDIISVDDETPRVKINRGLKLSFDQTSSRIGASDLSVTDIDSVDGDLLVVITHGPIRGQLTYDDGDNRAILSIGDLFTMDDLTAKNIIYTRDADSLDSIDDQRDYFVFKVSDGYNDLIDRKFFINIEAGDRMFPMVFNEALALPEDGRRILTTTLLKASDLNSNDLDLTFNIIRTPLKGRLESTDRSGVKRDQFTMRELVGSKIRYVHTADDEIRMDAFEFSVTDGTNTVYRTFRVNILPVDNKLPIVQVSGITLNEGTEKLISPYELGIEDADTEDNKIEIIVVGDCVHGTLNFNGNIMATEFTLADLKANRITYKHDGSETVQDQFRFVISDGTHKEFYLFPELKKTHEGSVTFPIKVVPVDDELPRVMVNKSSTYISQNPDGSRTSMLTSKHLRSTDRDSFNAELTYIITTALRYGELLHLGDDDPVPVSQFRQDDLDKKLLVFKLFDGVNATEDFFIFSLIDQGGNELHEQKYSFQWSFISLKSELMVCDEIEKELIITVQRRGFLGETSFVTVEALGVLAEEGKDFRSDGVSSRQVQINPGQSEAVWKIMILQDDIYEENEDLQIKLSDPVMSIFEDPILASVEIIDPDDESMVLIPDSSYETIESIGKFRIPIKRVGDISKEFAVICSTVSGTAGGTGPIPIHSFYDYISRVEDHSSVVRFNPGQSETYCEITIIDDSLYEDAESFSVVLSQPTGGKIDTTRSHADVTILEDPADMPSLYFHIEKIDVQEDVGKVEFKVFRKGSDLSHTSSCIVRSRSPNIPTSLATNNRRRRDAAHDILNDLKYRAAQAGTDYVGISKTITFDPEETEKTVSVIVLDDVGSPIMEGLEQFEVYLSMPQDCVFTDPQEIVITIDDRENDKPEVSFRDDEIKVTESDEKVVALIIRKGDLNQETSVRCYTRQIDAAVGQDYIERPNTDDSLITFVKGQSVAQCVVLLVNDLVYENKEDFRLVLGTPVSPVGAKLGAQSDTLVFISDDNDEPTVGFEKPVYEVVEPAKNQMQSLRICIVRTGDLTSTMTGRIHTKDGNAESGLDYVPVSKVVTIEMDQDKCCFEIQILYDEVKEIRESFTVWLKDALTEEQTEPLIQQGRTIVYIKQRDLLADVTFPTEPTVVSLADYDKMERGFGRPISGYPVICVTACDPKSPRYEEVRGLCEDELIDNQKTEYRWRISAPTGSNGATYPMTDVSSNTFFTSVNSITLDSIYFSTGSRVQCHARAVKSNGEPGRESASEIATISNEGLCPPRQEGVLGADPFSAKIRYVNSNDPYHPNTVKISIILPHSDGIMPLISTRQLTNFEFTLSQDSTRTAGHSCSNLLLPDEVRTRYGFLTNSTINEKARTDGDTMPHQYSPGLRGERTLRFYKNLNLEACIWEFDNWFDMSELQQACGGEITTDGQVLNLVHSYVSLQIPLYVSYISHSPTRIPWRHYDLSTDLRLTFVYDTAKMWTEGIGTPPESELPGTFYPTSMKIRPDGRLVVRFKTVARFHGMFVIHHPGTEDDIEPGFSISESTITSTHHQDLTFTFTLERSDATFNYPEQQWSFISNYAVTDYSGDYKISLIPCTAGPDQEYSVPPKCNPRAPVSFNLPIRAQQVSDPVAEEFSLNTTFALLSKRELWLADTRMQITESSDVAFPEGAQIYGRVQVDPVQSLGSGFSVHIEKVFLCSGSNGYIPKYQPSNSEYGCLADAPNLLYRFKVIDKEQPDTEDDDLNSVPFNAILAIDDPNASRLSQQAGADGFQMDSTPLFQVNVGAEWYLHTIYTVRSSTRKVRRHAIQRREANDEIGPGFNRGTNMHVIPIVEIAAHTAIITATASNSWIIAGVCATILIGILVVILVQSTRSDDARGSYAKAGAFTTKSDDYKPITHAPSNSSASSTRSGTEV